jgi:hemolysin III
MSLFAFREPVNAWTHLCWFLLSVPATILLVRRCRGEPVKQLCFLIYGICLGLCFAGSAFYHAVRFPQPIVEGICQRLDFIGIYLLIAGSVTPVAVIVLRGNWRRASLGITWGLGAIGITARLANANVPRDFSNVLYLAMGWSIVLCYFELTRRLSRRGMSLAVLGGISYTAGAVLNWKHWPELWPGVFSAHEVFHLFVMGGSLLHFLFMWRVVAPYRPLPRVALAPEPAVGLLEV